jgi:hypothetical protein
MPVSAPWGASTPSCALALALLLAPALGCKRAPPQPAQPPALYECWVKELTVDGAAAVSFSLQQQAFSESSPRPVGRFTLSIRHEEPPDPDPRKRAHLPAVTEVCAATTELTLASYTGVTPIGDRLAALRGTLDHACPAHAPEGRIVAVYGTLRGAAGEDLGSCKSSARIPAALGGRDLYETEQAKEVLLRAAAREHPAELAEVEAYRTSLLAAAARIEPPAQLPPASVCGAAVKGEAPIFGYAMLVELAQRTAGAPPLKPLPAAAAKEHGLAVALKESGVAEALDPERTPDVIVAAAALRGLSKYAIVYTPVALSFPTYDLHEAQNGRAREGQLTHGTFAGVAYVLDRTAGAIACVVPFSKTTQTPEIKGKPQDLMSLVLSDFRATNMSALLERLHVAAAGLVPSKPAL